MSRLDRTLLVCPTLNPGDSFDDWLNAYNSQQEKPAAALIIDSSSDDGSIEDVEKSGFIVNVIDRSQFSHGGTRQQAVADNAGYDYVIFLTQDALLYDRHALSVLLSAFEDTAVAAVCGRQLPRHKAGPVEAHARHFSYPDISNIRSIKDAKSLGIKAAFMSNSFAAYRRDALLTIGGFPEDVIFGEDMYVAARLLMAGYKIAYAADAKVYHSHDYSIVQEMKRYFDMGVFHAREPWIRASFGVAENAGSRFVISELNYLAKHAVWRLPEVVLRNIMRYAGFRLGLAERYIPLYFKKKISMNARYFNNKNCTL